MKNKTPFLEKMKKTLLSLDESKFEVKENGKDYAVYLKRVVVVGPIPEKSYAEQLAGELNAFIENRKRDLNKAIKEAEKQCESIYLGVVSTISGGLSGQPKGMEGVFRRSGISYLIETTASDHTERQSKAGVQHNSNEVQLSNDENSV